MKLANLMKTVVTVIVLAAVCLAGGCGDEMPSATGASSSSSSSSAGGEGGGGGAGGGAPACYTNPQTHVEIINACTDAENVDKVVNLPLLQADGSLPPLP